MSETQEPTIRFKFNLNQEQLKEIEDTIHKMEEIFLTLVEVEHGERGDVSIEEEAALNNLLSQLEERLLELLNIDCGINVVYGPNDGHIYPSIVLPTYINSKYLFWIEISPQIAIYVPKPK